MHVLESKTICVDIDHTLCVPTEPGRYEDAECMPGAREVLKDLRSAGWIIVLLTGRHFNHWQTTTEWLSRNRFEYDQIVFGKPPARFYLDDRAIPFDGDWNAVRARILDVQHEDDRSTVEAK